MDTWKIPLTDIDLDDKEVKAVARVLQSRWLTMGAVTEAFEKKFASYLGVRHAFAVTNGTAALHIAHRVLGLKDGDEVICPSLTFVATVNSILYTGASPVFADIFSLDTLNISPKEIESLITEKTRAITVVHYGGYPCDMQAILSIARRYKLSVVEDAAHAPGAEIDGKKCGTFGDVGCFSFFSNKNMITGEGGMVVTNRDDLVEHIRRVRSHGMTTLTWDRYRGHAFSYDVMELGYNYRMDELRAAIGRIQLQKLEKNNARRAILTSLYRKGFQEITRIVIPFLKHTWRPAYHLFPILLPEDVNRQEFMDYLKQKGVQTSIHYPPVHRFSFYRERANLQRRSLPITEEVGRRVVTLPLYPGMTEEMINTTVNAIREFMERI